MNLLVIGFLIHVFAMVLIFCWGYRIYELKKSKMDKTNKTFFGVILIFEIIAICFVIASFFI